MEELETKLGRVITELSNKLEKQELSRDEFDRHILKLMWGEDIFLNSSDVGYYRDTFRNKIQAERRDGLRATYVGLPEHFSEKALRDIEAYEGLVSSAREHLMAKFGEEIHDSQFSKELDSFVFWYATKKLIFSPFRMGYLDGLLSTQLRSKFKIVPTKPSIIGISDYERMAIDNVLNR